VKVSMLLMISLVTASLCLAGHALAKDADNSALARPLYEKALKLFRAGDSESALPFFEMAYELMPNRASTLIGLGQCERKLGMYSLALVHFSAFVGQFPQHKNIARVHGTINELRKEHAKLHGERQRRSQKKLKPGEWSSHTVWLFAGPKAKPKNIVFGLALKK
jgi:tetratricopeptide (TPR) repeat protein